MSEHLFDGPRSGLSRREFLRRAGMAGIAIPSMAAILAACGGDDGGGGGTPSASPTGLPLARPNSPVTIPVTSDNPAIADGLAPEAGPLKILGYNDYIYKKVLNSFEDKYKTSVEWTVFDTPEQMVAKMQSSGSDFDLIVSVTLENIGKLGFSGLIQPLNKTYIPNSSNVWSVFQDPFYDQGAQYTMPYIVYSTGIAYVNTNVPDDVAAMENPWDILWDAKYAGKTHLLNGARDTLAAALMRMGADVNTADPQVLDQAKQMLLDGVDTMNWKFDHVDYNELGSFDIHMTWSGQVAYYQYFLPKGLTIDQFTYVWPPKTPSQKTGIVTNDVFAIPKGAASPVLAHAMIDYLLDPEFGSLNYSYEGFQPPLTAYPPDKILSDGLVPENLANILLTEADFPLGQQELELAPATNQLYQQIYQQVTGGA